MPLTDTQSISFTYALFNRYSHTILNSINHFFFNNYKIILIMDPFLGQLMLFAGNFAPRGWALCQGQMLSIQQNSALFALLGTQYGGVYRSNIYL